ncbi:hypothetical protein B0H14DRAFT_2617479 [Mycena olivaceomarginata]|nr:hypothetical protein B0H14DRAFT_2617479 [Mycena olivaceomarginata]
MSWLESAQMTKTVVENKRRINGAAIDAEGVVWVELAVSTAGDRDVNTVVGAKVGGDGGHLSGRRKKTYITRAQIQFRAHKGWRINPWMNMRGSGRSCSQLWRIRAETRTLWWRKQKRSGSDFGSFRDVHRPGGSRPCTRSSSPTLRCRRYLLYLTHYEPAVLPRQALNGPALTRQSLPAISDLRIKVRNAEIETSTNVHPGIPKPRAFRNWWTGRVLIAA